MLMRVRFDQNNIRYSRRSCPPALSVSADADRLQQVLLNLLTNASKFTPEDGEVWISCEAAEATVKIHVADTGVGIPADQLTRIFEPFAQVDAAAVASQQGVGLGLAISRELVRAMSGELSVASEPGKGSTFTITLPAATS
jgi:signal transduction histidine kinase